MNKRGLSEVITTLLFVLLALGAVLMVWVLVRNLITSSGENVDITQATLDVQIEGKTLYVNAPQEKLSLVVKRGAGKGNVTGVNVIIEDSSGNTFTIKSDTPVAELSSERIDLSYAGLGIIDVTKVSIAPIYLASSGKEQIGSAVSPIKVSESQKGKSALQFDGVDDRVELLGISLKDDVSMSVWAKVDESVNCRNNDYAITAVPPANPYPFIDNGATVVISGGSSMQNGFYLSGTTCNSIGVKGASSTTAKFLSSFTVPGVNTKEWNHYVYISGATKGSFYINGIFIRDSDDPSINRVTYTYAPFNEIDSADGLMDIGHARGDIKNDRSFQGLIDDVRIYNRALTAAEVSDLYKGDYSGGVAKDNLFRWYKFDEGVGNTGSVVEDSSENGIDATNFGAVWVAN